MKKLLAAFSAAALLAAPAMLEARDFDPVPRLILRPHGGQIVKSIWPTKRAAMPKTTVFAP